MRIILPSVETSLNLWLFFFFLSYQDFKEKPIEKKTRIFELVIDVMTADTIPSPSLVVHDVSISANSSVLFCLNWRSGEATRRGKLLAHFSFTAVDHQSLGLRMYGATPVHGTGKH